MLTIAVIADKGGVGKSTLSIHLAAEAAQRGKTALILGCDPQACSEAWFDVRNDQKEDAIPPSVLTTQAVRVPQLLEKAKLSGVEFTVIDTGANSDNAASYATRCADLVLIPTSPRFFDMRGIPDMASKAREARKPFYVVLNRVLRGPYLGEALAYLEASDYPVAPQVLHERVVFANALLDGTVAQETEPDGKAARELRDLFDWIMEIAGDKAQEQPGIAALA